jgi:hypothetical protein
VAVEQKDDMTEVKLPYCPAISAGNFIVKNDGLLEVIPESGQKFAANECIANVTSVTTNNLTLFLLGS